MKLARDGVQDYEYLYKLNSLSLGTFVNTQVASWITNSYNFDTSGAGLNAARLALGNQMHNLSYGNTVKPPFAPTAVKLMLANYVERKFGN